MFPYAAIIVFSAGFAIVLVLVLVQIYSALLKNNLVRSIMLLAVMDEIIGTFY
jgi:hypothetical protein